jgi:FAD/FMN-containing dehydrogenase
MVMGHYPSWGNYPRVRQTAARIGWIHDDIPLPGPGATLLPRGLGRSYGDSCLNDGGVLLDTSALDHLIAFDADAGLLRCESGVSLAALLERLVPNGWFPPVCPGTRFVTIGGAIANDIHGKNHHRAGTFGHHVVRFELLRSDGRRLVCSEQENPDWFRATIGGLGLTGLITWAEIRLRRIPGPWIDCESLRFSCLDEFFELTEASDPRFEYTVAWIDAFARGAQLGRGIFIRGNHATQVNRVPRRAKIRPRVPVFAPAFLLNRATARAFNFLYYQRTSRRGSRGLVHHAPFFFPLDGIRDWNRLYGRRGFLQYQCALPLPDGREALSGLLGRTADAGAASFLAVLKVFGGTPSRGLLSFPLHGVTLALDFPNRGERTFRLLEELDAIVRACGGRVYPAKDARMSPISFEAYYPRWRDFAAYRDPAFSSSFWRRVTEAPRPAGSAP